MEQNRECKYDEADDTAEKRALRAARAAPHTVFGVSLCDRFHS